MTTRDDIGERVSRLEGGYDHLATKSDIADVRTELANVKAELKADIVQLRGDVDSRFAKIEAQIAQLETRMFLRLSGLVVAAVAAAVGFSRLLG